jgi:hypothetical protein
MYYVILIAQGDKPLILLSALKSAYMVTQLQKICQGDSLLTQTGFGLQIP